MQTTDIAQVAARCLKDAAFAQEILEGKHHYPEVREAMLKDIAEAVRDAILQAPTGATFLQTFNPALNPKLLQSYIQSGPKPGGVNLGKLTLNGGSGVAACW